MHTHMASPRVTATNTAGHRIGWFKWLVVANLGLVALEALSAGFLLSGFGSALTIHAGIARALLLGAVTQAIAAIVLWRRGDAPAWLGRAGIGLLVIVVLQMGAGFTRRYWLHVPIGVGLFGGLIRHTSKLDTVRRTP
jgi:hypothetical protein